MGKLLVGLQVRDPFGRGQAFGTAATVQRTDGALAPSEVQDTLNIFSVYGASRERSVSLTRLTFAPTLASGARTSILVSLPCASNSCTKFISGFSAPQRRQRPHFRQ